MSDLQQQDIDPNAVDDEPVDDTQDAEKPEDKTATQDDDVIELDAPPVDEPDTSRDKPDPVAELQSRLAKLESDAAELRKRNDELNGHNQMIVQRFSQHDPKYMQQLLAGEQQQQTGATTPDQSVMALQQQLQSMPTQVQEMITKALADAETRRKDEEKRLQRENTERMYKTRYEESRDKVRPEVEKTLRAVPKAERQAVLDRAAEMYEEMFDAQSPFNPKNRALMKDVYTGNLTAGERYMRMLKTAADEHKKKGSSSSGLSSATNVSTEEPVDGAQSKKKTSKSPYSNWGV